MGRPSKSTAVLEQENKSHRTKAELKQRAEAEQACMTGKKMRERPAVKADEQAHKEWLRVKALLDSSGKNDALYEAIINRYCTLYAECLDFEHKRAVFSDHLDTLMEDTEIVAENRYRLAAQMQKNIMDTDKQLQTKRKMMLDIEKECAMTIASAMRSIPKTPVENKNPVLEALLSDD